jgi:hypothetical protein
MKLQLLVRPIIHKTQLFMKCKYLQNIIICAIQSFMKYNLLCNSIIYISKHNRNVTIELIKVGGWTGWGSGAKRNGGDPLRFIAPLYSRRIFAANNLLF